MDSVDLLPLLHQQGSLIIESNKEGYTRPSFSINTNISQFIELFTTVQNTFNQTIYCGFSFNISPYIMKNIYEFTDDQIIQCWIKFGEFLDADLEYPSIYGFLEGISSLFLYKPSLAKPFLDKILHPIPKNLAIIPLILSRIYQYVDLSFFSQNISFIFPLINDYFKNNHENNNNDIIINVSLLSIMSFVDLKKEELECYDDLIYNMWNMIYSIAEQYEYSNSSIIRIITALIDVREKNHQIFEVDNKYFHEMTQIVCDNAKSTKEILDYLIKPLSFSAFLNRNDLEFLYRITISYESTYLGEYQTLHKESLKAIDRTSSLYLKGQIHMIQHILEEEIETINYPSAICIWSQLQFFYEDKDKSILMKLIEKIKLAFTTNYPLKLPLFYALNNITDEISSEEAIISELFPYFIENICYIPSILSNPNEEIANDQKSNELIKENQDSSLNDVQNEINISESNENTGEIQDNQNFSDSQIKEGENNQNIDNSQENVYEISLTYNSEYDNYEVGSSCLMFLIGLLRYDNVEIRCHLNEILNLSPYIQYNLMDIYFAFLVEYAKTIENPQSNDLKTIGEFLLNICSSQTTHPSIRSKALRYFSDFYESFPDLIPDSGKIAFIDCFTVLQTYPTKDCAKSIEHFIEYDENNQAFSFLCQLSESDQYPDRKSFLLVCSRILFDAYSDEENEIESNKLKNMESSFNFSILEDIFNKSDDTKMVKRSIKCLTILRNEFYQTQKNIYNNIFPKLVEIAKTTKDIDLVNYTFSIFKSIISDKTKVPPECLELLFSTLQGRITLFNHIPPYQYLLTPNFKFFSADKHFTTKFPSQSHTLVETLVSWIPSISIHVFPYLCKSLKQSVKQKILAIKEATILYDILLNRISEDSTKAAPECHSISLAAALVKNYEGLSVMSLFSVLEDIWDKYSKEEHVITFIGPLFLDLILRNISSITQKSDITKQISKAVVSGEYYFDGPTIASLYLRLLKSNPTFCNPNGDCALVFGYYLSQDRKDLENMEFDTDLINAMFTAFKSIIKKNQQLIPQLSQYFERKQPLLASRIKAIINSNDLPRFIGDHNHSQHCHCAHHHNHKEDS